MLNRVKHFFNHSRLSILSLCLIYFVMLALALDWVYGPFLGGMFSSDLVYIESLYQDIFIRGYPLSGWLVSRAPFFFPDWVLFFLLRSVLNYGSAWYCYLVIDLGLLILFFYGILRLFYPQQYTKQLLLAICWGTLLILLFRYVPQGYGMQTFILPVYHSGVLLNGLLIFYLWLRSLIKPFKLITLVLLTLFCTIATMSDEWWIMWFGVSIGIASILLMLFWKKAFWRSQFLFLCALGVGVVLGELVVRLIAYKHWLYFSNVAVGTASSTVSDQLHSIVHDLLQMLLSSPLLLVLFLLSIVLCSVVIKCWKRPPRWLTMISQDRCVQLVGFHIVVLFAFILPFLFIIYFRLWGAWNYRYISPLLFLPWVVVGLHVYPFVTRIKGLFVLYLFPLFLFVPLLYFAQNGNFGGTKTGLSLVIYPPYAEDIACADKVNQAYNLHLGLSEYGYAKYLTEQSHTGLWINQVTSTYDVYHWMNNLYWYLDKNDPKKILQNYDFFPVTNSTPSWATVKTVFGIPSDIVECGQLTLLIYQGKKQQQFDNTIHFHLGRFFDSNDTPMLDNKNILDNGDFNIPLNKTWQGMPIGQSQLEIQSFSKAENFGGDKTIHYMQWRADKSAPIIYIEKRFPENILTSKALTLTFWARSLNGSQTFTAHGYLVPHGLLDSSALYFAATQGSPIPLNKNWQKITIKFDVPETTNQVIFKNSYALIRPLFSDHNKSPQVVDIANVKLFAQSIPLASEFSKNNYADVVPAPKEIPALLAMADHYHEMKNWSAEYKVLKKAELTLPANYQLLTQFIAPNNQTLKLDLDLQAELLWRLARINYIFGLQGRTDERNSYVELAFIYANEAYRISMNADTLKWWAFTTLQRGQLDGVRQQNITLAMFPLLIQQALVKAPNSAELYALMGEWNLYLSKVSFWYKLQSALLFSSVPKGSALAAVNNFKQAVALNPNNTLYRDLLTTAMNAANSTTQPATPYFIFEPILLAANG